MWNSRNRFFIIAGNETLRTSLRTCRRQVKQSRTFETGCNLEAQGLLRPRSGTLPRNDGWGIFMNWEIIEEKANHSIDLAESEAKWLLERREPEELNRLYQLANRVNERLNGRVVSFIHNMNVNYTNICEYHCTFCEFKKSPISKHAYILKFEDVKRALDQAESELSEITFQGGLSPAVKFREVLDLLS